MRGSGQSAYFSSSNSTLASVRSAVSKPLAIHSKYAQKPLTDCVHRTRPHRKLMQYFYELN